MSKFKCSICGNEDERYLGNRKGVVYCRRCISFCGERADSNFKVNLENHKNTYFIKYALSEEQDKVSLKILDNFKNKKNSLIYAVCGAGKTELVYRVIEYGLKNNLKIGFAIPRRDVVIELSKRLQGAFKDNKVISLYGGHNSELIGDIICLTTHQLYRYERFFDLLILDEIDAFPYKDNPVLNNIFKRSVKGNYVLMSATPSNKVIEEILSEKGEILKLFKRYHNHPLPVPKIKILYFFTKYIYIIKKLKEYQKENKPVLIFVATIDESKEVYEKIKYFVKQGYYVNSRAKKRPQIIEDFRNGKYKYLVTTSVLERGVTLPNLQVIIFNADHTLFNEPALVQISGRAGRTINYPKGDVIFIASKKTSSMESAIKKISGFNSSL